MTAITSFYLGANTVTSAKKAEQAEQASTATPAITDFAPQKFSTASTDPLQVKITGANLNKIVNGRLTKGDSSIAAKTSRAQIR